MQKNLWKCVFRVLKWMSFSYFPKVALDHEVGSAPIPFRIFVDHVTIFKSYVTSKMELSMRKQVNA